MTAKRAKTPHLALFFFPELAWRSHVYVDLPQVDLMNFRVEYVRPQSRRCLGCEAAERATKLWEVDLSRLKGFHLRFTPKKWEVAWLATGISDYIWKSLNWMAERICSTPIYQNNRMCVRFSCIDPKSTFVYSVLKWLRRKILSKNWPKLVWILNWSPERR